VGLPEAAIVSSQGSGPPRWMRAMNGGGGVRPRSAKVCPDL